MKTTIIENRVKSVNEVDLNAMANSRQTYALYNANRAASKINGCPIHNDWHKQNLTVGECLKAMAEYNKVTGYVYQPKTGSKKPVVNAKKGAKQVE